MMNPKLSVVRDRLRDIANALDREWVHKILSDEAVECIEDAVDQLDRLRGDCGAAVRRDNLEAANKRLSDEAIVLRGEIARLNRTVDANAAALFVRAVTPESNVVVSRSKGQWRVSVPYPVAGQSRVAYSTSLSEAFGKLADNMRGVSF